MRPLENRSTQRYPFNRDFHLLGYEALPSLVNTSMVEPSSVINPPAAKKYQYWTNDSFEKKGGAKDIEAWRKGAAEHPGSWWPDWDMWLSKLSGKKIPARNPGDGKLKVLGDAPGTYVKVKDS